MLLSNLMVVEFSSHAVSYSIAHDCTIQCTRPNRRHVGYRLLKTDATHLAGADDSNKQRRSKNPAPAGAIPLYPSRARGEKSRDIPHTLSLVPLPRRIEETPVKLRRLDE